jgi:hypothetical protein
VWADVKKPKDWENDSTVIMRTGGLGEQLDCGYEDWKIRRTIGLCVRGLEDWENDWTLGMWTGGLGGQFDCGHENWKIGRTIGLWA